MATNDDEAQVVPQVEEEHEEDITPEDDLTETTDWEAEAKKARRIASRYRNQVVKLKEAKRPTDAPAPSQAAASKDAKPGELNDGQLAFLIAKGIEADDEVALIQQVMKDTGKPLKEVVASKYVQAELKEMREAQTTKDATPSASRRASASSKDNVDYWLTKPFADVPKELRSKVLAAREARERNDDPFRTT